MNTKWANRYSVGVDELDRQHQKLFSIFYTLLELDSSGSTLTETLNSLLAYTHEHFTTEERYMAECNYPGLEEHRRSHDAFLNRIAALCGNMPTTQNACLGQILSQIYEWLITHVCSCDQQYKSYIRPTTSVT
ncbi:MAG: hemerythrin family protein [Planctomycetaceae bacterium]|nr:hemerythrin family protein [Planctomycetaceae bacterium]